MNPKSPNDRRKSLLVTLTYADHGAATVREMRREMELVHNLAVSADLVRGDFAWLAEQGLVRYRPQHDSAQVTERGQDVARGAAVWPGGPD